MIPIIFLVSTGSFHFFLVDRPLPTLAPFDTYASCSTSGYISFLSDDRNLCSNPYSLVAPSSHEQAFVMQPVARKGYLDAHWLI